MASPSPVPAQFAAYLTTQVQAAVSSSNPEQALFTVLAQVMNPVFASINTIVQSSSQISPLAKQILGDVLVLPGEIPPAVCSSAFSCCK